MQGPHNCYPLPPSRDPQLSEVGGRGHRAGGKGEGLLRGRGQQGRVAGVSGTSVARQW